MKLVADALEEDRRAICEELSRATGVPAMSVFRILTNYLKKIKSDGDVKPGGLLGAFREEQAMIRHRVSPSPFLSSSSNTTQLQYTNSYIYSNPNLNFLKYTLQILIPHVMWSP